MLTQRWFSGFLFKTAAYSRVMTLNAYTPPMVREFRGLVARGGSRQRRLLLSYL
jgi:hypothetical protein